MCRQLGVPAHGPLESRQERTGPAARDARQGRRARRACVPTTSRCSTCFEVASVHLQPLADGGDIGTCASSPPEGACFCFCCCFCFQYRICAFGLFFATYSAGDMREQVHVRAASRPAVLPCTPNACCPPLRAPTLRGYAPTLRGYAPFLVCTLRLCGDALPFWFGATFQSWGAQACVWAGACGHLCA